MALQPGDRLGPYEIRALLGVGGMGEVYRARHTRLGREVAIKILSERLAGDPRSLMRFEREARAVAALSHPNILAIHKDTEEGASEARRLHLQALEKDPKFVEARLGLVATYGSSAVSGYAPPAEASERAEEEARKVLALDPGNASARASLALRRFFFHWDWAGTERELAELSNDPQVLLGEQFHPIGMSFWARGRTEDAIALSRRTRSTSGGGTRTTGTSTASARRGTSTS